MEKVKVLKKDKLRVAEKSKTKNRKKSIRTKFILLFTSIVFIPIVIVSIVLFYQMQETVTQRVLQEQRAATRNVVEIFESIGHEAESSVTALSQLELIRNAAEAGDTEELERLMSTIQVATEYISDVFIYLPDARSVGTLDADAIEESKNEWLSETAAADGDIVFSQPYSDVVTSATTMSATMKIEQTNGETSILGVQLDMGSIAELVDNTQIGKTGAPFVITNKGYRQFTQNTELAGLDVSDTSIFTEATDASGELYSDLNARAFPIYYEQVPDMNLIVYGAVTPEEMSAESTLFFRRATRVLLVSIAGALLIALLVSNYLVQVTRTIEKALGDLQMGKLKTRLISYRKKPVKAKENQKKPATTFKENGNELHQIGLSFNRTVKAIEAVVNDIQDRSVNVDNMANDLSAITVQTKKATEEVTGTIQSIAESSSIQTQDTRETVKQMEELSDFVSAISENMQEVGIHADQTVLSLGENDQNMNKVNMTWNQTVHSVNDLKHDISSVDAKVQDVESILRAIQNISEQTNLLALNASIEAARAGEAGKGFSVVAEEIRKLAEKSNASSDMIADLIGEIQNDSSVMVKTLDQVLTDTDKQTDSLKQVTATNEDISLKIQELARHISRSMELVRSVEERKANVVKSLDDIEASAGKNTASTEEVSANSEEILASMEEFSASIDELKRLAGRLRESAKRFS
ncbi:methyl-accepting chemotaxis protein [Alkalibacterium subtropicum]|uniref:Methyl-accepting chemotaxis protein n=1 Tax=Alkalibacterium subtropicum TaxID=753702 RepID=A0A1I1ISC4_9LACT|nr:methyl-accepting chemotaxis protein [Alkalibacterium subtropicum]SFC39177.1 methyl-accepting chemotaxis protein [Alkalibacterium subtropicum]